MTSKKRKEGWVAPVPKEVTQAPKTLKLVCALDLEPKEVDWLWRPYVAKGMVTLLEGDPGLGKSWLTMAIASAVSTGEALPGQGAMPPQNVLILNAEDRPPEYSLIPRLITMGADRSKVFLLPDMLQLGEGGLGQLKGLMQQIAATIVFVDPLVAYLGAGVDMHRANEVRPIMAGLADLAASTGSAMIAVRHLRKSGENKGEGQKRIFAGLGSIDFAGAVRSILQVEGDHKSGTRIIHHIKSNIGKCGPCLTYSLQEDGFQWGEFGEVDFTPVSKKPKALDKAKDLLSDLLAVEDTRATEVFMAANAAGISESTIKRAKADMGVEAYQAEREWFWRLPASA